MNLVDLSPNVPVGSLDVLPRLAATTWPDRTALQTDASAVTFAELDRRISRLAAGLREQLGGEGSVVVVSSALSVEFATAYYATVRSGNVVAPVNPRLPAEVFEQLLLSVRARAVVLGRTMYERVRPALARMPGIELVLLLDTQLAVPGVLTCAELAQRGDLLVEPRDRDENELGAIAFSGGETRAAGLTHGSLKAQAARIGRDHGLSEDSVALIASPSYHPTHLNAGLFAGATQVLFAGPDPAVAVRAAGGDHFHAVPDGTFRYVEANRRAVA